MFNKNDDGEVNRATGSVCTDLVLYEFKVEPLKPSAADLEAMAMRKYIRAWSRRGRDYGGFKTAATKRDGEVI